MVTGLAERIVIVIIFVQCLAISKQATTAGTDGIVMLEAVAAQRVLLTAGVGIPPDSFAAVDTD